MRAHKDIVPVLPECFKDDYMLQLVNVTRSFANAKRTARPLQKYLSGTPNIWEIP